MKEFILDIHRCSDAPRHLFFNMTINDRPDFGQFTNCKIGDDPYYHKKSVTLKSYGSLDNLKNGTYPKTVEDIPTEQIKILDIIDKDSKISPTPLSTIIDLSDNIYNIDTSFDRQDIKEKMLILLNELSKAIREYGNEHPNSNYKTTLAFIKQEDPTIQKLDSIYNDTEQMSRETMKDVITRFNDKLKLHTLQLIFTPQYQ